MLKKIIFIFLISSSLSFASENLPEVNLESLKFAKIVKKEIKVEVKKENNKKTVTYYSSRKSIKCTSGFG